MTLTFSKMISSIDVFINFQEFDEFYLLSQAYSTILTTSRKKVSPCKKYFFKRFNFECFSPTDQKIILDTFHHIYIKNCQYLLSYKYISFTFPSIGYNPLLYSPQSKLTPTFSMRYVSSKTLEDILKEPNLYKKWEYDNYLNCLFAVAEAMLYLHDHLICHGNLCPSNIVIDEAGQFYVCDFGLFPIKKLYIDEKNLFNEIYKDPNMENNEPTFKNDIYSFGILMCELLFAYFQSKNEIKRETLSAFINNPDQVKFNTFPKFFAKLIPKCLNSFLSERPTFKQIIDLFQNSEYNIYSINIKDAYNQFIYSNYFINLAIKGDAFAKNKVGNMYFKGKNVKKDYFKAMEYYKQAADLRNSEAQNKYGLLLQEKAGKNESIIIEGARYLKLSAEQGNIHGMANYGVALLKGNGVEKNIHKAEEYLKKSADLGYSIAQYNYGLSLLDSNLTINGINEGLKYIKKSMNQMNAEAYYTYGFILLEGKYIDKNEKMALEYFKTAADLGSTNAMIKFADCNLMGIGVPKNEKIALQYYYLAYGNGNYDIKNKIDELTKNKENPENSLFNVQIKNGKKQQKPTQTSFEKQQNETQNNEQNQPKSIQVNNEQPKTFQNTKEQQQRITQNDKEQIPPKIINDIKEQPKENQSTKERQSKTNQINKEQQLKINQNKIEQNQSKSVQNNKEQQLKTNQNKIEQNQSKSVQNNKEQQLKTNQNKIEQNQSKSVQINKEQQLKTNQNKIEQNQSKSNQINKEQQHKLPPQNNELQTPKLTPPETGQHQEKSMQLINLQQRSKSNGNQKSLIQEQNKNPDKINKRSQESYQEEFSESSEPYLSQSIDLNLPSEDLIKEGDDFLSKNDPSSAFKCYKEAAKKGNVNAFLKCANFSLAFDEKIKYYELAIKNQIPNALNKWLKLLRKRLSLAHSKETFLKLARLFEKYDAFPDAVTAYKNAKDIINSEICYEKAKKNIDNIEDGHQQYIFAKLLKKRNEFELATALFKKSLKNGILKAEEKIKEISQISQKETMKIDTEADNLFEKGIDYYEGRKGMSINYFKAYEYFTKASTLDYPKADLYIGKIYQNGIGMKKDMHKALCYFKMAADKGLPEAQFEYGKEKYENGSSETEKEEGIQYLMKSAEQLFPDGLYLYSQIIKETNPEDSNKFYEYSVELGSKLALKEKEPYSENNNENSILPEEIIQNDDQVESNDQPDDDFVSYSSVKEWRPFERDSLQRFLIMFGWNRWDNAHNLSGLKRPIQQIKLASRAFLRTLLSNVNDASQFPIAHSIIEDSMSNEFDPDITGIEDAEESDADFMRQTVMSDYDFVQSMERNCKGWIKRIELLYLFTSAVEKANRDLSNITVPKFQGNLPTPWWTTKDDQCLIYGTWKHGFARYEEMYKDKDIPFTCKEMENTKLPPAMVLTPRIKKIANEIMKESGDEKSTANETKTKRKYKPYQRKEISSIYQNVRHRDFDHSQNGTPVMPVILTQTTRILSLGHIVTDRPGFHCERYIYPAGFKASRIYASCIDPTKKVNYTCEIIDTGESNPLFRVTMDENPQIKFEGNAPSTPCRLLIKQIVEQRKENSIETKALAVSGPEFFGLASPLTVYLIQNMEGAKECDKYIEKQFPSKWDKQHKT